MKNLLRKIVDFYYGIKKAYPRLPLSTKIRAVIQNSRPLTLMLPLVGGYFVIQASLPHLILLTPNLLTTLLALLALVFVNAGGNNLNSIFDVEIDAINKPYRPIPRAILSRKEVGLFSGILLVSAVSVSLFVNPTFQMLAITLIMLTIIYSTPPIRLKRRLWINNVSQAVARGVLGVLTAWSVFSPITKEAIGMSLVLFSFILWAQSSKDIADLTGDKAFGVKTLPVAYGISGTYRIMSYMASLPFATTSILVFLKWLPTQSLLTLLLFPLVLYIPRGTTQISTHENTIGWICFYLSMLLFLLVFSFTI